MNDLTNLGLSENNGKVVVSSRVIAKNFEKEHKDVLKSIRTLGVSEEFSRRNFAPRDYVDNRGKTYPEYLLTRDGFTILVMGYNGDKAMQFKEAYITAFNEMEHRLTHFDITTALKNPDFLIGVLTELKTEREKSSTLTETVEIQKQQITEMKPKASYYDLILNCKDAVSVSVIAKDYGKSAMWLNEYLHRKEIQYRQGNIWLLYQKHAEYGYTLTKTHTYLGSNNEMHSKVHTYWTQKGRLFIYDLLKGYRCLPLIERPKNNKTTSNKTTNIQTTNNQLTLIDGGFKNE